MRARTRACVLVRRCVNIASAIVKLPALPLYAEDGRCTNVLYYYDDDDDDDDDLLKSVIAI